MLVYAAGKPLLVEIGYPSSELLGSSEAMQAEFFVNARALSLTKRLPQAQALNLFDLHDAAPATCAAEAEYYGAGVLREAYIAYRCSLGPRRADGSPKAAWQRLFALD